MKPLHPTKLAVSIRHICNQWPAFAHVKPAMQEPEPDLTPVAHPWEDERLAHQRQRQAYLQSLGRA